MSKLKIQIIVATVLVKILILIVLQCIYEIRIYNLCNDKITVRYDYIAQHANTGDIILSRSDNIQSGNFIRHLKILYQTAVDSIYGHGAVILKHNNELFAYSVNFNETYDIITKKNKSGVTITPLSDYIINYPGLVFYYKNNSRNSKDQSCKTMSDEEIFQYASEQTRIKIPFKSKGIIGASLFLAREKLHNKKQTVTPMLDYTQVMFEILKKLGVVQTVDDNNNDNNNSKSNMKDIVEIVVNSDKYKEGLIIKNNYLDIDCIKTSYYDKYRIDVKLTQ